jgi:hypothetical protein
MKLFVLALTLLVSSFAFAEVPVVVSRQVNCQELKDTVANYGTVKVRGTFLRIPTTTVVERDVQCSVWETKYAGVFKTKDIRNCQAGFFCRRDMPDHDFPRCHGRYCIEN